MTDTKPNHTNSFFNIYKRNIACYYNAKKILKIINEGTTNIAPNVSEMLIVFEENSEKIKSFNSDAYDKHYKLVKRILCNLFNIENQQRSLLNSFIKPGMANFSTYMESISDGMQFISKSTSERYNELSGFKLPTDEQTFGVAEQEIHQGIQGMRTKINKHQENFKFEKKLETEYDNFLKELAGNVFRNYSSSPTDEKTFGVAEQEIRQGIQGMRTKYKKRRENVKFKGKLETEYDNFLKKLAGNVFTNYSSSSSS